MIAVVKRGSGAPCVAKLTARKGLKVKIDTYCGETVDASDGVLQVPDNAEVCAKCGTAVATAFRR